MNLRVLSASLIVNFVASHFETSTCGKEKECIFVPEGCQNETNCRQLFSYKGNEDGWIDMEMFSHSYLPQSVTLQLRNPKRFGVFTTNVANDIPTNSYMAVGFSEDESMGNEPVTQCVFPEDAEPSAHFSFNVGKHNLAAAEGADQAAEEQNLKLVHAHKGEDGMYCHVRQRSSTGENRYAPDLNKSYQIFLARGLAKGPRALDIHALSPSSPNFPYISSRKINVAEVKKREAPQETQSPIDGRLNGSDVAVPKIIEEIAEQPLSRQTKYWLKRFHGILMIFSWIVLIASGILSARYLRDHFPTSTPCGLKWWFHIHRTLNVSAVPFILLATLFVFISKDWSWQGPAAYKSVGENFSPGAIHSLLGLMAVLIAVMQPFIALMRCQPDTGARPIFNWTHRIMGITGILFALIAILIAANSFEGLWSDASWAFGIAIFYVVITILTVAVLELLSYVKSKSSNKTSSMEMRNRAQHRFDDSGKVISTPPKTINKKPMYGTTAVYIIFVLFSLCIAALLIIMLSV